MRPLSSHIGSMRILLTVLLLALVAMPLLAAVQTWNHVTLVDAMCAASIKANPDAHTTECALHCGAEAMGLLTTDGTFLKFDDAGTKQALAELKATKKKDGVLMISDLELLEASIVGIPANPRSWVSYAMKSLTDFEIGGIKFPEAKIGETVTNAEDWLSGKVRELERKIMSDPLLNALPSVRKKANAGGL